MYFSLHTASCLLSCYPFVFGGAALKTLQTLCIILFRFSHPHSASIVMPAKALDSILAMGS